ncbi:MAG: PD40 domain-containing protein [Chloroflexi bacterium]|nr:PD40 domain-containing protein [Chloroflexota bacterium]
MTNLALIRINLRKPAHTLLALLLGIALEFVVAACIPINLIRSDQTEEALGISNGQIVYVGADWNIYLTDIDGSKQTAITTNATLPSQDNMASLVYLHPTWARDGQHLAYVQTQKAFPNRTQDTVFIYDVANGESTQVYASTQEFIIYPYWSPDNQNLSLLTNAAVGSHLLLQMTSLGGDVQVVDTGGPYYWSFDPSGERAFVHSGRDENGNPSSILKLLTLDGENSETTIIDLGGATFQAPTWSKNGDKILAAIRFDDGHSEIVLLDAEAEILETITRVNEAVAFGLSPDGTKVALIEKSSPTSPLFQGMLRVFDLKTGEEIFSSEESRVFAFFWSPDSQMLAYYTYQFVPTIDFEAATSGDRLIGRTEIQTEGNLKISVGLYDLSSGETNVLMKQLTPSNGMMRVMIFFDQYQHSDTFWSPDSRWLLVIGAPIRGDEGIWVLDVSGEASARFLAEGILAFWSWR